MLDFTILQFSFDVSSLYFFPRSISAMLRGITVFFKAMEYPNGCSFPAIAFPVCLPMGYQQWYVNLAKSVVRISADHCAFNDVPSASNHLFVVLKDLLGDTNRCLLNGADL